ncbi:putative DNA repair protein [Candidatus Nasuia deltocephalinicola]|nr:putative DNA repair protein [Candidatus Nasuia deltocephalinicola]
MKKNISIINSIGILNKSGILIKIIFYKKKGNGKIFIKNFLDKKFIDSIKNVLYLIKKKFIKIQNIIKLYNIFIIIYPLNYLISGYSINLAIFVNFLCLINNLNLNKKLIIIGNINKSGIISSPDNIRNKIFSLNLNNYILIIPKNNYENLKNIYFKNFYNLTIIEIKNLNQLLKLLNIN